MSRRSGLVVDTKNILQTSRRNMFLMEKDPRKVQNNLSLPTTTRASAPRASSNKASAPKLNLSANISNKLLKNRLAVNKTSLSSICKSNYKYYRSAGFTKKFMGYMFEDTSMDKKLKKEIVIERMRNKMSKIDTKRQLVQNDRDKKKKILSFYRKNYDIKLKNISMPIEKLEDILSAKVTKRKQQKASLTIQTAFRKFIVLKKYKQFVQRRLDAASYIQRVWKRYRMISMVPKAWKKFKNERICRIQKYMRGYIVHKRTFETLSRIKLTTNFEYFGKIKDQLHENSQIKIRYYWLKWKKNVEKRKKAKAKAVAKNKRPKLSNKFNSFKKGSVVYKNPPIANVSPAMHLNSTHKESTPARILTQLESSKKKMSCMTGLNLDSPAIRMDQGDSLSSHKELASNEEEDKE
ncbi:unnamed protein product [Moneuplotes crassus]|uniref:Uncharacterized protein n=1 Tax=Euplotes crassus TaxID=5936 RepID=A0AAD1UK91_EUPCR|nr:unnamed protein product [Moneuplotes crassus]